MLLACLGNDTALDSVLTLFEDADETLVPGFGLAWVAPDDLPATYHSSQPAILDDNLDALGRSLFADCWLAQSGFGLAPAAPQPLTDDDLMALVAFDPADWPTLRVDLRTALDPDIEAALDHTDPGAGVFALLRTILADDDELPVEDAIVELVPRLAALLDGMPASLSLVVGDGDRVYALRRAWGQDCAPLVFTTDCEMLHGAQVVASQVLDDTPWQSVPPHHLLVLDREQPPVLSGV
jgi:gamma-glutamyl hercynylcysteine S-oxide hydrolase